MRSSKIITALSVTMLLVFFCSVDASAQRLKWKRSKPETLFARNKHKQVTPIYIGIGTKTPTAQLHTVGSIRFEGLTVNNSLNSVLAVDGNGNLFWKDMSNSNSNAWFLNGNTITASHFFGTTNSEDIRIRTNNTQRAVITSAGLLGLGVTAPAAQLHTNGTVRFEGLINNDVSNRMVSIDNNGNLFWRDAASVVGTTAWLLNGNNATSSSFLGTTGNEDLRIRTNNIQRAVLTTNGSFGLGVTTTTAQLHTNGTIRFEGVTNNNTFQRLALFDNNGNLFYRDLASLQSNFWSLTGNTGTNPATNFLGTADNNRLVFRTNNTEKMTILANGNIGIGVTNPLTQLHISNSPGTMTGFPYEAVVIERNGDMKLGVFCSHPSPVGPSGGGVGVSLGYSNFTNPAGRYPGYEMQFGALSNSSFFLRFASIERNAAGTVVNALANVMVLDNNGNVGINLGTPAGAPNLPTAKFHTIGTLRHEGLAAGSGNPLVIDANGNVFVGTAGSSNAWNLTGNAATNPATNFLGTTDNNRFVFRTNNTEKMTILADGSVGIGLSNPSSPLHVYSPLTDNQLFLSGAAPSTRYFQGTDWLTSLYHARIGLATGNANYVTTSSPGDFIVQAMDNSNLIFGAGVAAGNGLERMRITASGNVGISTLNPTAKLHTNGTVRHEGLAAGSGNPLVIDANGNVFIGTAGASNAWNLTGNAATNPATNFLGTTDNNRLVFRTNNTEKMTILANGNVGINNTSPASSLEINNAIPDDHLRINGEAPSIRFVGSGLGPNDISRFGLATQNNFFTSGSQPGDFILQTLGATTNLIFGTGGGGTPNGIERARINSVGYFGIATLAPTAKLHVNCAPVPGQTNPSNIRLENLPTGTGNALVIDANGYVYKSTTLTGRPSNEEITELKDEIKDLKKEIDALKSVVNSMKGGVLTISENKKEAILYQNAPNPFKNSTIVRYFIPAGSQNSSLIVNDLPGNVLKSYRLNGEGQKSITIPGGELSSGTYVYTLFVNGKEVDSKKMILTR
jgi:hypothetical protein